MGGICPCSDTICEGKASSSALPRGCTLSLRPASGRAGPRFDSVAALLGRLFLRPVLVIVTIVLIEPRKQ